MTLASIWAAITAALSTARVGAAVAAIGITSAALCATGFGAWVWFASHDAGIRAAATAACHSDEQLRALLEERAALQRAALTRRNTETSQRDDAAASAARIKELEDNNEELRTHVAALGGDTAIVFGRDDRWLQKRRTGAGAAKAGSR